MRSADTICSLIKTDLDPTLKITFAVVWLFYPVPPMFLSSFIEFSHPMTTITPIDERDPDGRK